MKREKGLGKVCRGALWVSLKTNLRLGTAGQVGFTQQGVDTSQPLQMVNFTHNFFLDPIPAFQYLPQMKRHQVDYSAQLHPGSSFPEGSD